MPRNIHKGTELNNVRETWEQNERQHISKPSAPGADDLERVIENEATEYDNANKEERLLGGERATVDDDQKE